MAREQVKWYLKRWCINNFYQYDIYQIVFGKLTWLEATPITPGVITRTADDENTLKIILENDCLAHVKFQKINNKRVR